MNKFIKYKTIAKAENRPGTTKICNMCKREYKDRVEGDYVICCKCINGLADGIKTKQGETL